MPVKGEQGRSFSHLGRHPMVMWKHTFLLRELVRRDFQGRYAGSLLGFLWSFVQPLWQLALFSFVFATVMQIPLTGERTDNFAVFLFCGLMPWLALNEGVLRSSTAITDNASLVKKIQFPAELLVLAVVLGAVVHQLIATAVFVVILAWLGQLAWTSLWIIVLVLPVQIALTLGLGFFLATVHTFFRDVAQVVGMVLMAWFYLTPIVYPLSLVPEEYRSFLALNPGTPLVALYRQAFLGGELGGWGGPIYLTAVAIGVLVLSWVLFRRLKPAFADEV